jgi:hypothetical protein
MLYGEIQKLGSAVQPIDGAVSATIGSAAIFMAAAIARNRTTMLDRERPTETDDDETVCVVSWMQQARSWSDAI